MAQQEEGRQKPIILLLESGPEPDEPDRLADFRIVRAGDARECIELAERLMPEAIVVDLRAPSHDASELVALLEKHPRACDVPVVFLSPGERGTPEALTRIEELYSPQDDPVTGLPGRQSLGRRVVEEISRSRRNRSPLSVLIVEIDDRSPSARRGLVLRELAVGLRSELRIADALFRYDEHAFAAVLPDTDVATAYAAAERVRGKIGEAKFGGPAGSVTASIGIAELRPGRTADELMARAEIALFRARESGGNRTWRADDPRRHGLNPEALAQELTQREWDVLAHLARRRTEQDIARRLGIRSGTVRSHKARIRRKLHISPNVRLTDFAGENFTNLTRRAQPPEKDSGNHV